MAEATVTQVAADLGARIVAQDVKAGKVAGIGAPQNDAGAGDVDVRAGKLDSPADRQTIANGAVQSIVQ